MKKKKNDYYKELSDDVIIKNVENIGIICCSVN